MFPVPKPSTVVKGDKSTYLNREAWAALNKEVQQSDEWKAHKAARQIAPDNGVKHSRAQASSPAAAPTKYENYGDETSQVIPALSRKSNAPVRHQRVQAVQTTTTPKLSLPISAPQALQLQNKAVVEVSRSMNGLSIKPKRKEKPESLSTVGTAYATTAAETGRLSSMA